MFIAISPLPLSLVISGVKYEWNLISGWWTMCCLFYDEYLAERYILWIDGEGGGKGDMQKRYALQRECCFVYARVNPQVKDKHIPWSWRMYEFKNYTGRSSLIFRSSTRVSTTNLFILSFTLPNAAWFYSAITEFVGRI